jgi:hypothetical protein
VWCKNIFALTNTYLVFNHNWVWFLLKVIIKSLLLQSHLTYHITFKFIFLTHKKNFFPQFILPAKLYMNALLSIMNPKRFVLNKFHLPLNFYFHNPQIYSSNNFFGQEYMKIPLKTNRGSSFDELIESVFESTFEETKVILRIS